MERFLTRSLRELSVVLIFGSDVGLVAERVRFAIRTTKVDPNDPFQFVRLDGSAITANPDILFDEADTIGLFGGVRLILVELASTDITPHLEAVLPRLQTTTKIILVAGALKRDAAVRRACERNRLAAVIECEPDREIDLLRLLDIELKKAEIFADEGTKLAVLKYLGGDRLSTRSELEKLMSYAHGAETLTAADVEAALSDASIKAFDILVRSAFSGNLQELDGAWARSGIGPSDGGAIAMMALREAIALHQYCSEVERDVSHESAEAKYRRAAFGRMPLSSDLIRRWTSSKANRAIEILFEAVKRTRLHSSIAEKISMRALWSVCFLTRN